MIFHSYVSLPEGNLNYIECQPATPLRFFDPELIRWGGDHVEVQRRNGHAEVILGNDYSRLNKFNILYR